jgi:N-methylhydantoinase B
MDSTQVKYPGRDPLLASVISNRLSAIIREMTNTMLRTARSAVINSGRDFSCAIVTGDNQLLTVAEGLPVHTFSSHMQSRSIGEFHSDIAEGDAFLHNDPYLGNTHPADQTVLVPVFFQGEHLFTAIAKAHQADIGNSIPSTYHVTATDIYAEGAVIFPCVRLQSGYRMNDDIIRMAKARIRVPEVWYGDLLAALGAARIAERRLKDLCIKYGRDLIKEFIGNWFDYSEQLAAASIRNLPAGRIKVTGAHDPIEGVLPNGIPLTVTVEVSHTPPRIVVDLTECPDNVPTGLNQSEATSINNAMAGVFNCLAPELPRNSGSFRNIDVKLRDGCVAGRPKFPHSTSIATTNVGDRIVNLTQYAIAQLGYGYGLAEGGTGMNVGASVISGLDFRHNDAPFVNQLIVGPCGGPGSPFADGWVTYGIPCVGGLLYFDSVEVDELKYPILFDAVRIVPGSGGAGHHRGAPSVEVAFTPRGHAMNVIMVCDGQTFHSRGVHGGEDGQPGSTFLERVGAQHRPEKLPNFFNIVVQPGDFVRGFSASGGGYGDPKQRSDEALQRDIRAGFETRERLKENYSR